MSLLPVDEAIRQIIEGVQRLPDEYVSLDEALGRTLSAPLVATRTQPPFPASSMDGYAVREPDISTVPATLRVVGASAAGHGFRSKVGSGEAVEISTGAPVPEGADTILIKENAERADTHTVIARQPAKAGRNIRSEGFDFRVGDELLQPCRIFGTREIALAAAMNHASVPVVRRPRVAIIATGDELVPPGETPGPDQIVASSGVALAAFVRAHGGEPFNLGIVRDERATTEMAIGDALDLSPDVLITLGGASVGDHDLVQDALKARGMKLGFWKIAMRPGKPLIFGRFEKAHVLGLPGNPVSSIVCAILFLKPLLDVLLGRASRDPSEPAVLGSDLAENDQRQDYLRATLSNSRDGLPSATALPKQDSSNLSTLARADCLIIRAPHAPPAKAGDPCRIIRLDTAG